MQNQLEAIQVWLRYADDDLEAAEILLTHDSPKISAAAFHCQQAAEKYLKAFLVSYNHQPPRTHNLEALLDVAVEYNDALEELYNAVVALAPFAVGIRYPGEGISATEEDAARAMQHAKRFSDMIRASLRPKNSTA